MTRRVADREHDRFVFRLRARERIGPPSIPIHWVVCVLAQVRTLLVDQPIRFAIRIVAMMTIWTAVLVHLLSKISRMRNSRDQHREVGYIAEPLARRLQFLPMTSASAPRESAPDAAKFRDESRFFLWAGAVVVLTAILFFVRLGARALWSSEFRWAEIAREMLVTHNYFWPTINGHVYYDKPLGSYWQRASASYSFRATHRLTSRRSPENSPRCYFFIAIRIVAPDSGSSGSG